MNQTQAQGRKSAPQDSFADLAKDMHTIRTEMRQFIWGQNEVIDLSLTALLAGGHAVLVGLPGLGKTRLVNSLGVILGLDMRRIQCTPDLMPADMLGSEILQQDENGARHFQFIKGPVFCQLFMADEINRASPRTQSALLEAMQEHRITIAGETRNLPVPFHVLATQNPLEQEGTYPLPEAQRDRFLMQIDVTYPSSAEEKAMVLGTTGAENVRPATKFSAEKLIAAQKTVRDLPVGEKPLEAALKLVRSLRPESGAKEFKSLIEWGPGPRATQALMQTAKARALLNGRTAPAVEDIIALAHPVLKHRMAVSLEARSQDKTCDDLIATAIEKL